MCFMYVFLYFSVFSVLMMMFGCLFGEMKIYIYICLTLCLLPAADLLQKIFFMSNQYLVILTTKIVSRCRRTLRDEGHGAAGWGIGGSV